MVAVYLSIAVSAAFLFAPVDPIRSSELEYPGLISEAYYTAQGTITGCLAIVSTIGRNIHSHRFSPLRLGSLRLFILFGIYTIISTLFTVCILSNIQTQGIYLKKSILCKTSDLILPSF
ncbi:MAG: hypothetical protein LBU25_11240 [Treponema sp.]|jgi:hypothetical protein|nr:hypothetical protein [Treponema sp.]